MESEGSFTSSRVSATGSYTEPDDAFHSIRPYFSKTDF